MTRSRKLSTEKIVDAQERHLRGESWAEIARSLGVSRSKVRSAVYVLGKRTDSPLVRSLPIQQRALVAASTSASRTAEDGEAAYPPNPHADDIAKGGLGVLPPAPPLVSSAPGGSVPSGSVDSSAPSVEVPPGALLDGALGRIFDDLDDLRDQVEGLTSRLSDLGTLRMGRSIDLSEEI